MTFLRAIGGATRHFAIATPEEKRGKRKNMRAASYLKTRPPEQLYIVGEDLDWSWHQWQVDAVVEDYNAGLPLTEIIDRVNRDYREVVNLIMELAEYGKIKPRPGGIFGKEMGM